MASPVGSVSGRADNVAVSATPAATAATTAELLDGEGEAELSADFDGPWCGAASSGNVVLPADAAAAAAAEAAATTA